jgi:enoyl-CoA hydratase/carnithine racemase
MSETASENGNLTGESSDAPSEPTRSREHGSVQPESESPGDGIGRARSQTGTETEIVTQTVTDGVAVLTFNRPERHNSWTVPLENRYYDRLRAAEADPDIRVIVVTGAGRSFCPGMDTAALADQAATGVSTNPHLRQPMTTPTRIAKPVIAAINGACAGIGLIAALNCDLRFVSATAKMTTAFVQRGIMAEHGLAWTLPRLLGTSRALDLLLSGRVVLGEEAVALGLADRVFAPEELMPETLAYAKSMAATGSPLAMGTIKRQVYQSWESSLEESRVTAIRFWMGHLRGHSDFKEGIGSFLEKRPPRFEPWDPATPAEPDPLPGA